MSFCTSMPISWRRCCTQLQNRESKAEREESRGGGGDEDVDDQPRRLQRRRQRYDLDVEVHRGDAEEHEHETGDEGTEESQVDADENGKVHGDDQQRSGHRELVHIRPRHAFGGDAPRERRRQLQEETEHGERDSDTKHR